MPPDYRPDPSLSQMLPTNDVSRKVSRDEGYSNHHSLPPISEVLSVSLQYTQSASYNSPLESTLALPFAFPTSHFAHTESVTRAVPHIGAKQSRHETLPSFSESCSGLNNSLPSLLSVSGRYANHSKTSAQPPHHADDHHGPNGRHTQHPLPTMMPMASRDGECRESLKQVVSSTIPLKLIPC